MNFFLETLGGPIFLSQSLSTLGILHTKFGLIWTTSWPDENDLFLKFVIREIRKFPYGNLTFFLGKLYQIFFLFYNLTARVIFHTEFGLIWITSWSDEKDLFLKVFYRNLFEIIANFRMKS